MENIRLLWKESEYNWMIFLNSFPGLSKVSLHNESKLDTAW